MSNFADADAGIADDVRKYGWSLIGINDHQPPFAYTAGLTHTFEHPELIVFGLESGGSHALVSGVVREIRAGRSFAKKGIETIELGGEQHRIGLRPVHPTQHELYLGFAMGFHREIGVVDDFQAMQVFWPDKSGKFPFEGGCDLAAYEWQPRLDIGLTKAELKKWRRQWE